jgi:hypothetical protein
MHAKLNGATLGPLAINSSNTKESPMFVGHFGVGLGLK